MICCRHVRTELYIYIYIDLRCNESGIKNRCLVSLWDLLTCSVHLKTPENVPQHSHEYRHVFSITNVLAYEMHIYSVFI